MSDEKSGLKETKKQTGKAGPPGKRLGLEVPWKWFLILHISVLLNSMSGVASKMAGRYPLMSMGFLFYYGLDLLLIFAFAIVWQQVLGHMSLTFAITNRPVRVIYSLIWSVLIFRERVTPLMVVGVLVILAGVVIGVSGDEQSDS